MQKIVPHLWFKGDAEEGADFYLTAFHHAGAEAEIVDRETYPTENLPDFQQPLAGQTLSVELAINDYRIVLINASDEGFSINPAISFFVNFDPSVDPAARANLDKLWDKLQEDGTELMPLGEYPHSLRYGWVQDRFGVSWQLMLTDPTGEPRPYLIPSLMFSGPAQNLAGPARDRYLELFPDSRPGASAEYEETTGPATPGAQMFMDFQLAGQWFAAMDSAVEQELTFNPGFSLLYYAADQAEIDRLWEELSEDPTAEACGWLRDEFGVSWQIDPQNIRELLQRPGAYQKLLGMKKIQIDQF